MTLIKYITGVLLATFLLFGCNNKSGKPEATEQDSVEVTVSEQVIPEEKPNGFHQTLTSGSISFEVKTSGAGSMSNLTIQPKGLEIDNRMVEHEIEGQVVGAEIGDLNADSFPEILIYTASAGSGSYGDVIGYSVNNGKSISQIYFPELSANEEAFEGYMGHDEFSIIEGQLIRSFPIYKDQDANSNPTGGTRKIQYKLENGEASRVFVIDKVVD